MNHPTPRSISYSVIASLLMSSLAPARLALASQPRPSGEAASMRDYEAENFLDLIDPTDAWTDSDGVADTQSTAAAGADLTWALGGYLPSAPDKKVYVTITGRKIVKVDAVKPAGTVLESESIIFPGMIDMHNHMTDGAIGLWSVARGQFLNRFEWRRNSEYTNGIKPIENSYPNGPSKCAAMRWAELKQLVGGVTGMQGSGSLGSCVSNYGINNVEVTGDFGTSKQIRGNLELIDPRNVKKVFIPYIEPLMKKGQTYEQALAATLDKTGVTLWMKEFFTNPPSLASGLKLAIGDALGASATTDVNAAKKEFAGLSAKLDAYLRGLKGADGKPRLGDKDLAKYAPVLSKFLFGSAKTKPYVGKPAMAAGDPMQAKPYFQQGAVIRIDGGVKRYMAMFEWGVKRGTVAALKSGSASAFVTHLGEGMNKDKYNSREYDIARRMGAIVPGMVLIHSVGMQAADFTHARANGISLVWSPFSNLLLYGETLDIGKALATGLNVAMGSDWSPSGSKSLLDELKIARRYLDKQGINVSDEQLAGMATTNAGKALRIDTLIGKVAPGYQADLTVISKNAMKRKKSGANGYSALVYGEHEDVSLVVVKGQPLYGDSKLVADFSSAAKDGTRPESMPTGSKRFGASCSFSKSMRMPFTGDPKYAANVTAASVEDLLVRSLAKNYAGKGNRGEVDALYRCEESSRTQYGSRFDGFVANEVAANKSSRGGKRGQMKLDDGFDVLAQPDDGSDLDDEDEESN